MWVWAIRFHLPEGPMTAAPPPVGCPVVHHLHSIPGRHLSNESGGSPAIGSGVWNAPDGHDIYLRGYGPPLVFILKAGVMGFASPFCRDLYRVWQVWL